MIFNSISYIVFLPIVIVIYYLIAPKYRWVLLLIASYYFYMSWRPEYIILIVISTLIDYYSALSIHKATDARKRKIFLFISLFSNLGILFCFKYLNFFSSSFNTFINQFDASIFIPNFNLLLPIGISFYTFQTISYTIDVYNKKISPEKHLGVFAVYVSFFPQLVAGPIERAKNLLPQLSSKISFQHKNIVKGLNLILWGFFKKIVIADRLAIYVNEAYSSPSEYGGVVFLVATVFFAFQIYCDFSGYSDIAIGSAKLMGIDLMKNFRTPYFSKSISEFWGRWHISLSTWFRDYLYIPLGGNRTNKLRWYFNLFVVFLISGLWHGANWTFVVWGALHGFYLIFSIITKKQRESLSTFVRIKKYSFIQKSFKILTTFTLVNIGWVFFRANSIGDALQILNKITLFTLDGLRKYMSLDKNQIVLSFLVIFLLLFIQYFQNRAHVVLRYKNAHPVISWSIYFFLLIGILAFGEFRSQDFIYFQF